MSEVPMATVVPGQIDLEGKVVTADALHTVKATANHIHERGGEFVLPVKENRRSPGQHCWRCLDCVLELVVRREGRVDGHAHVGGYGGAAVADDQVEDDGLGLVGAYVGPYVGLGGVDPELPLDLGLFLGCPGRAAGGLG
jgi:hypothetical protein